MAWTSAQVLRAVMPADAHVEWTDPTSACSLVERRVAPLGAGRSVAELEATGGVVRHGPRIERVGSGS